MADDGFTAFFQDAYPRVVGQLRLLTGDLASAEDAAQEAFVRAASRWRQLARYDQPEAWVRMTAFRLAIDLLRRARRQRGLVARLGARREGHAELHPQDRAVIEALLLLPLPLREVRHRPGRRPPSRPHRPPVPARRPRPARTTAPPGRHDRPG